MTSSKRQTIRARIADEAITKVMQFFDGTLAQALHEILQNARRSEATSVAITHDRANHRITVSDDGRGIGDPRTLLAFGRSGWPKDLHGAEHPAGMGIFSLARRSPRIRSRVAGRAAWSVQLGEDHFVGRAPAAVAADPGWDRDHGTGVTFSVLPTDSCWTPGVIADAVRHYPIPRIRQRAEAGAVRLPGGRGPDRDLAGTAGGRLPLGQPHLGDPRHQLPRTARGLPGPATGSRPARRRRRRAPNVVGSRRRH